MQKNPHKATDFQPLTKNKELDVISRPSVSFWKDAWRRLLKNKLAMAGLIIIALLTFLAIFGPLYGSYDHRTTDLENKNLAPSFESQHLFGTDDLGRDMYQRIWYGMRISLFIGLSAALIDLTIGVIYGSISAFSSRTTDNVMMRFADILSSIPYLLVVILLMVVLGDSVNSIVRIIIALSITGWIPMARIVRGQILQLKEQEFVLAARALGANTKRLIFKHLIPNAMGPIIVTITLTIPSAIFAEAFLSFLGIGVEPPAASLGSMANDGLSAMRYFPWRMLFPALFISLIMFACNVLGDGLRDALDPKMRK
ncbi:ABC transporter permease [Longirhabdus pacifica]|uniref:ABC transporter permease n=1 Tax=Longirhabdus pacifica TaxID=2305227 RepID=UPI001008D6EA|nr:ABC transporter permease [Longirhabdus pacifica]